jgi:competence protein ComEA
MKNAFRFALILAPAVLAVSMALQAAPAASVTVPEQAAALPDTPATPLFVRMCSDCHQTQLVLSRRRTVIEWEDTVRQMIAEGAEGTDKEFEVVLEFLFTNFGTVVVNGARADDMVKVLGISKKDADAIVAFRTAKGDFANVEALKQVPEIDIARIEQRKDALRF